jgi:hypothetical protein
LVTISSAVGRFLGICISIQNGNIPYFKRTTSVGADHWLTPNEYADTFNPRRDLTLRSMPSYAPAPVAHIAPTSKTNRQSLNQVG